jgi:hypothetical protein
VVGPWNSESNNPWYHEGIGAILIEPERAAQCNVQCRCHAHNCQPTHKINVRIGPTIAMKHVNKHIITRLSQALPDRHTNLMSGLARPFCNETNT